jgi:DNA helicase HerA-like ATPase
MDPVATFDVILLCAVLVSPIIYYVIRSSGLGYTPHAILIGKGKRGFAYSIPRASMLRHLWITGQTGSGKSTLMANIIQQTIKAPQRYGMLVIDVKDDFVLNIASRMQASRAENVILLDFSDKAFPVNLNLFANLNEDTREQLVSELITSIKRIADTWGPRMEHVLRASLLALTYVPEAVILDVIPLLTNPRFRSYALPYCRNQAVTDFFENEFPAIVGKSNSASPLEPILNKLGILSLYEYPSNVFSQPGGAFSADAFIAEDKIVLVHCPKAEVGDDVANFICALLFSSFQLALQRRVRIGQGQRKPYYIFADEFQNYSSGGFETFLAEARALGGGLIVANQYPEQLTPELRKALANNVAYQLACRVVRQRAVQVVVTDLKAPLDDPKREIPVAPLPPIAEPNKPDQLLQIQSHSRRLLTRPREEVQQARRDYLARFHASPPDQPKHTTKEPRLHIVHQSEEHGDAPVYREI